jgi:hypothetical protein
MSTIKTLTDEEVGILVRSAGSAPSMHNTQPWRFDAEGSVVDVVLDEDRTLPIEDPSGRLVRIGLGAATFNLRVAAAMLGYESTFALDPDPVRPELAARVFVGQRRRQVPLGALYVAIHSRHTYRGPMTATDISPQVLQLIAEAARAEEADLHWLRPGDRDRIREILHQADQLDTRDHDRLAERRRWIGGERTGDGVPREALGPRPDGPATFRDLAVGPEDPERPEAIFESHPLIAVLTTPSDGQSDWLRAGMALQRALLTATLYDVAASFLNQPLERPTLREQVRDLIEPAGHPQQVIRFGRPVGHGTQTPRRFLRDLVTKP